MDWISLDGGIPTACELSGVWGPTGWERLALRDLATDQPRDFASEAEEMDAEAALYQHMGCPVPR